MTATTIADTARQNQRKRVIRSAQVAFSVAIVVAIFAYDISNFAQRIGQALGLTTLVSHLGLYLVFLLTIRLVGITATQVSWAEVLGIFSLGRLATAVPITPGGVTYLIWQRNKSWRKPVHPEQPSPVPVPSS